MKIPHPFAVLSLSLRFESTTLIEIAVSARFPKVRFSSTPWPCFKLPLLHTSSLTGELKITLNRLVFQLTLQPFHVSRISSTKALGTNAPTWHNSPQSTSAPRLFWVPRCHAHVSSYSRWGENSEDRTSAESPSVSVLHGEETQNG